MRQSRLKGRMRYVQIALAALAFYACSPAADRAATPQDAFFSALSELCGQAFAGRLVSSDEVDVDFGQQSMVMHVRACSEDEIRIPFYVGEDRSRTWVITRQSSSLRLKHDHRHEDGSEDAVTQYGGDTANAGTATRQSFPVDDFSIEMFGREGLSASVVNVWAVEVHGDVFAYELSRPNRFFRVEFDLSAPVDAPPPPWGFE